MILEKEFTFNMLSFIFQSVLKHINCNHKDEKISDQKVIYKPTDELKQFVKENIDKVDGFMEPVRKKRKINQ